MDKGSLQFALLEAWDQFNESVGDWEDNDWLAALRWYEAEWALILASVAFRRDDHRAGWVLYREARAIMEGD